MNNPAPWRVSDEGDNRYAVVDRDGRFVDGLENFFGKEKAIADRVVLAENAGEVMMRRGWSPRRSGDPNEEAWMVDCGMDEWFAFSTGTTIPTWLNLYTALVEADRWATENGL